jgi:hypothetical protein
MSTHSSSPHEHFFHYTSGRWLWDEERQKREHFRSFNVAELQRIAAESVGARACVSMSKLAEGGYNKVFRLVMDNDSVAIARIPNPNAGPAHKTTASEVATMDFVSSLHHSFRQRMFTKITPSPRLGPSSIFQFRRYLHGAQQQIIPWKPSIL